MSALRFNYNSAGLNEAENNLVLAFNELVSDYRAGKANTQDYKDNNRKFSESFVKYCVESAGREYTGIEMVKNPQLSLHNSRFVETFTTLFAQMITPAVPAVISDEFNTLWETTQVGWGN